ncbi:DUF6875 domain-containing protein [Streptomyces sp. NPDC012510]|uniref:DUF6875 domain-containing protein n=1 Tax=Streptomyces sp. NPDC012510 TaxID=3364838 RepID=UPI0036E44CE9
MGADPDTRPTDARFHRAVTVSPLHGYEDRAERDLRALTTWLRRYVSRPHPKLGRKGPICPFVPVALNAEAVGYHLQYEITGKDPDELREVLAHHLQRLPVTGTTWQGASLDSLIVALPDLVQEGWEALDEAHARLKDFAVERGLMIGQFHPGCDERSVRNDGFSVSRSPIPLLAVRHMASHDILFLHERPHWFAAYRSRFHAHHAHGRIRDPLMLELFAAAERRRMPWREA